MQNRISYYLFSSLYSEEWDHFSPSRYAEKLSSKGQGVFSCISFKIVVLVLLFPVTNITYHFIKTLQPAISKFWLLQPFGCNLNAILGDNKLHDGTRTLPQRWAKLHVCILLQEEVHNLGYQVPLSCLPFQSISTGQRMLSEMLTSPRSYPDVKTMQASASQAFLRTPACTVLTAFG